MAINTTVRRYAGNPLTHGSVNISFVSTTGFVAGAMLGIGGDLAVQLINELPMNQWKVDVVRIPIGSKRILIRPGDVVQDTTIPT